MSSPTLSTYRPPARNALSSSKAQASVTSAKAPVQFSGGPDTVTQTVAEASTDGVRKLSLWETFNELRKQMTNPQTRKVFNGLALKYGPDLLVPALFSVPVIGWGAGLVALPFVAWASNKGEKMVETANRELPKDNALKHAINMGNVWNGSPRSPSLPPLSVTERLVNKYNKFIKGICLEKSPKLASLRKTLSIQKDGWAFQSLHRLVNAREALQQKWFYKIFMAPFDWLYKNLPGLPRSIKMIALLPKFAFLGLFYALGLKPR